MLEVDSSSGGGSCAGGGGGGSSIGAAASCVWTVGIDANIGAGVVASSVKLDTGRMDSGCGRSLVARRH